MVVKPEDGSQGDGIFLAQSFRDCEMRLQKGIHTEAVVQEYIKRPLLLDGLKFDFRIYVIVIGLGEYQRVFICEDGLGRFCTVKYVQPF